MVQPRFLVFVVAEDSNGAEAIMDAYLGKLFIGNWSLPITGFSPIHNDNARFEWISTKTAALNYLLDENREHATIIYSDHPTKIEEEIIYLFENGFRLSREDVLYILAKEIYEKGLIDIYESIINELDDI